VLFVRPSERDELLLRSWGEVSSEPDTDRKSLDHEQKLTGTSRQISYRREKGVSHPIEKGRKDR